MANVLDSTGLTLNTREDLIDFFNTNLMNIYGSDINLSSDTPDGQWIGIMVQAILDIEDLIMQVYNSFDPDNAIGVVLDQRVAINGIQRQAGTYTITPITVVNSQSVNLYGLDQEDQEVYTVADNAGNKWFLQETQLGLAAGSHSLSFRAAIPGAELTIPNTITVQVTIVLGVTSVNNPTTYSSLGVNEESDANLRLRRQRSVSLASQGYLQGLLAALENISGVTSAYVYENTSNMTDSDGVPGHSIWVIVAGSGSDADIADAIYRKRNAGCGMFGAMTYDITQVDGTLFPIYWDTVVTVNLFIKFTATSINGTTAPNVGTIRTGLPESFMPTVYEEVNINGLATDVQVIDSNTLVTNAGFSNGQTQVFTLSGVAASGAFKINYNGNETASISWNDSISTIQTKLQAVTGLSTATATGSIASQTLTFDLSSITDIQALLYVTNNTLQTSAPAAITFSYDADYQDVLLPDSKKYQFVVSADNILILPMLLSPSTSQVAVTESETFVGYGGYGDYVYSILTNNSGGSIDASTGVYTAGAIGSVTDVIKVVDAMGNSATASVLVTT